MTSPEGGFYSALDADSEGHEGKFYVWSKQEVIDALADKTVADIFCEYYGITQGGNFEGKNILNVCTSAKDLSQRYQIKPDVIDKKIRDASIRLFDIRKKRVRPGTDDKILTSWNALMISGFVKGFRITNNAQYLQTARRAIEFIESKIAEPGGRLNRTYKNGSAKLNAYLDDYSFYVNALLDIFEVDSDPKYLDRAIVYNDFMLEHFWDQNAGNLFFTSDDHEHLIVRTKNLYDLAIPSGNSMAALNLLRLYHITMRGDYLQKSEQIMKGAAKMAVENPFGFGQLLIAMYLYVKKPVEITIVSGSNPTESPMANWLSNQYIPDAISSMITRGRNAEVLEKYPFYKGKILSNEKNTQSGTEYAFVCRDFTCSLPIHSVSELRTHFKPS
jgi:uncharacterized protein YyaL (SSP411 family)